MQVLALTSLELDLAERQVITFPLEALDPHDPMAGLKRAKRNFVAHVVFQGWFLP